MSCKDRPKRYLYWPIRFGWFRCGTRRWFDWHQWPAKDSPIYPDATAKVQGWTIHVGPLKIKFGR